MESQLAATRGVGARGGWCSGRNRVGRCGWRRGRCVLAAGAGDCDAAAGSCVAGCAAAELRHGGSAPFRRRSDCVAGVCRRSRSAARVSYSFARAQAAEAASDGSSAKAADHQAAVAGGVAFCGGADCAGMAASRNRAWRSARPQKAAEHRSSTALRRPGALLSRRTFARNGTHSATPARRFCAEPACSGRLQLSHSCTEFTRPVQSRQSLLLRLIQTRRGRERSYTSRLTHAR